MDELGRARLAAHANAQRVTELEAELAYARPMADAAYDFCAAREKLVGRPIPADGDEIPLGYFDAEDAMREAKIALVAAYRATTPSPTPSSHVIVERAEWERLRAIAGDGPGWSEDDDRNRELGL